MSEASHKLSIATYFISSSPTGEVDEVVSDVQKLLPDSSILTESALAAILRDYNHAQFTSVLDPSSGKPVIVSQFGQVGDDAYLDPASGRVLSFDHIKRVWSGEAQAASKPNVSDNLSAARVAISASVAAYLAESFKPNKSVSCVYVSESGVVTVVISAKNVNLGNFWTGSWRSNYSINVSTSGAAKLAGQVKTHVHYFEDGNVQLTSASDLSTSVTVDTADHATTAKRVADAIAKFEGEYQNELEEMYVNMHRTTFKAMRRMLPVNRQKFVWSIAAHSLAAEVNK